MVAVNYFSSSDYLEIPRAQWGVGMSAKKIIGGLVLEGRGRLEKLSSLILEKRVDPSLMITTTLHVLEGVEKSFSSMKDKAKGLIKSVVVI